MPLWRWAALLGFALVAPAALPAGGGERRLPEVRRRQSAADPLLSPGGQLLRSAPRHQAPVIRAAELGMPLRVLRRWRAPSGEDWFQVELAGAATSPTAPRRGWLPG